METSRIELVIKSVGFIFLSDKVNVRSTVNAMQIVSRVDNCKPRQLSINDEYIKSYLGAFLARSKYSVVCQIKLERKSKEFRSLRLCNSWQLYIT